MRFLSAVFVAVPHFYPSVGNSLLQKERIAKVIATADFETFRLIGETGKQQSYKDSVKVVPQCCSQQASKVTFTLKANNLCISIVSHLSPLLYRLKSNCRQIHVIQTLRKSSNLLVTKGNALNILQLLFAFLIRKPLTNQSGNTCFSTYIWWLCQVQYGRQLSSNMWCHMRRPWCKTFVIYRKL